MPITVHDLKQLKTDLENRLGWQSILHDDNDVFEMKIKLRDAVVELISVLDDYHLDAIPNFN